MESPYEKTKERRLLRQLDAQDGTGLWERQARTVEEDALQDL
jgi:hypothetical protein